MKTPAILLIVVGLIIVVWGAFGFTTREKIVDIGPIHASKDTQHNIPYAPIVGGLLVVGGAIMMVKK